MKKVSSLINAYFKHATQLKIQKCEQCNYSDKRKKKNLTRQTTFKDIEKKN